MVRLRVRVAFEASLNSERVRWKVRLRVRAYLFNFSNFRFETHIGRCRFFIFVDKSTKGTHFFFTSTGWGLLFKVKITVDGTKIYRFWRSTKKSQNIWAIRCVPWNVPWNVAVLLRVMILVRFRVRKTAQISVPFSVPFSAYLSY